MYELWKKNLTYLMVKVGLLNLKLMTKYKCLIYQNTYPLSTFLLIEKDRNFDNNRKTQKRPNVLISIINQRNCIMFSFYFSCVNVGKA